MVTMTWGFSPPAAGRPPVVRDALQAPTRPSRSRCGRVRRSRASSGAASVQLSRVRGLVAVFITVRRGSHWSGVAKISMCCRPRRAWRRNTPWRRRSSSSDGSDPSWSIPSIQRRATRDSRSASLSTACRVSWCSIRATVSSGAWCRTFSRARVMMVAERDATVPAATAAASTGRSGGSMCPVIPVRGSTVSARLRRRRASAMLIRNRARRNSAAFRHPSSAGSRVSPGTADLTTAGLGSGPSAAAAGPGPVIHPSAPARPAHRPLYCRRLVSPARDPPGRRAGPRTRPEPTAQRRR